nr:hypothetical protein [Kibdelosporangium sp. MJ126-NF4]
MKQGGEERPVGRVTSTFLLCSAFNCPRKALERGLRYRGEHHWCFGMRLLGCCSLCRSPLRLSAALDREARFGTESSTG